MLKITDRRDTDTDTDFAGQIREVLIQHRRACGLTSADVTIEVTVGDITLLNSGMLHVGARPYAMEITLYGVQDDSVREIPISWEGYVEAVKFLLDIGARKIDARKGA